MFHFKVRLRKGRYGRPSIRESVIVLILYVAANIFIFAVPMQGSGTPKATMIINWLYIFSTTMYSYFTSSVFLRIARLNNPLRLRLYIWGIVSSILYAVMLILIKANNP
ncbi:MAG: hypothetical protein EOP51_25695 [Sphingobacteriales bacterium]|nr:MAG: hypothetical protein EOP51_25695 [Sphingobacteriales bacterium]